MLRGSLVSELSALASLDLSSAAALDHALGLDQTTSANNRLCKSVTAHIARALHTEIAVISADGSDADSLALVARLAAAECRLAMKEDDDFRVQGRLRDLSSTVSRLNSENVALTRKLSDVAHETGDGDGAALTDEAIISPRSALTAAIAALEFRHTRALSELEHKHAEELQHTLQYKYLFAQLASKKEDLELALELEKARTRRSRTLVDKCIKATIHYERSEHQLAETVARLAHQLIEAGIPIRGDAANPTSNALSTTTTADMTVPSPSLPSMSALNSEFSATERALMLELLSEDAENEAKLHAKHPATQTYAHADTELNKSSSAAAPSASPTASASPSKWWPFKKSQPVHAHAHAHGQSPGK